ncbi:MAG TPA: molybdopterin cofactor-binding domain-containing protein [Candidatus Polarisedimenticolaceae bacterium]|nr:molybdopterin cofactor-binding domain-containing protein [Candidatus Polarisedimenticolaceae bacterium]
MSTIGKPRRRVDGRAKVTGQTRFADDLNLPRTVHCKLLRSKVPHATIRSIDTSRAETHPGVLLVLTGAHFPITFGILPVSQDEDPLCRDRVRFVGDPVAAVIATEEAIAGDALDLIEVDYEVLPGRATPLEAYENPEPRIHEYGEEGNVHKRVSFRFGDTDEGFEQADRVFEDVFFFQGNTHLPIEQHATVAAPDPDGKLVVWSSTQVPHYLHRALSRALDMPAAHIRVIATPNGGGFGGKTDPFSHEIVVAKAAMILGRPVKIGLTREEVFYCHRGRHPVLMKFKTGVKKDGSITSMHLKTFIDGGAYGSYGVASTFYTGALQTVTYRIPRYRFEACRMFTNKPPCGPKRGHGTPQPRFGQEVQLDKIAEELKIDPAALRLKIVEKPDTTTANYMHVTTIGLAECIKSVVHRSDWANRYRRLPHGKGLGLACSSYLSGAGLPIYWNKLPHSGVQLKLDRSGGVTAFCGATEVGQGSDDVLVNIVAHILGIDPFDIRAVTGDTDLTPVDLGSYSSRVTLMMGNAAIQAAERARDLLAQAASKKLDIPKDRLVFADRRVFDAQDPNKGMTFQEAVIAAEEMHGTLGTTGSYTPPRSPAKYKGGGVGPSPAYSYTACVVEVDVDPITGWIHVPKVWIAHDIGKALNPVLARGQVEGSVYMGLGEALMEEQVFRRLPPKLSHAIVHKIPSILEYKSPTSLDMPEIDTELIEHPDPRGPFGAKEVGQGPLLPIMPAVANAVYDAVGVRIDEVPITPEKIVKALDDKAKGKPGRYGPESFPDIAYPEPMIVPPPWEGGDGNATNDPGRKRAAKMADK